MKCPVCAAERGASMLCPCCGFRDVIPAPTQQAAYEAAVRAARAAYEASCAQRQNDADAAYGAAAEEFARAFAARKETELRLLAQKSGAPFFSPDSPQAKAARQQAISAALKLAKQAEATEPRGEFEADRLLQSRMTQAATLSFQRSVQAAFPPAPSADAYFAGAAAFAQKTAQAALSAQCDALRRVYPRALLPGDDFCRQLQARLTDEQLARIRAHWDANKAQPRFVEERLLQSALREEAQKSARAALLTHVEEALSQFRRAYLDRGAEEIHAFSAAAFHAAQAARVQEAKQPVRALPPEDERVQALLSRCERELCAVLEQESQTRYAQVVAGFSRDGEMQNRLRAAAVKFFAEQEDGAFWESVAAPVLSVEEQARAIARAALSAALAQRKAEQPGGLFPGEGEAAWNELLERLTANAAASLHEGRETKERIQRKAKSRALEELENFRQKQENEALRRYRRAAQAALPERILSAYRQAASVLLRAEGKTAPPVDSPNGKAILKQLEGSYRDWLEQQAMTPGRMAAVARGFAQDEEILTRLQQSLLGSCFSRIEAALRLKDSRIQAAESQIDAFLQEQKAALARQKRLVVSQESPEQFRARLLQTVQSASVFYQDPNRLAAFVRSEYEKRAEKKVYELGFRLIKRSGGLFGLGKKEQKEQFFALSFPSETPASPLPLARACPDGETLLPYARTEGGELLRYKAKLQQAIQPGDALWTAEGPDGSALLCWGAPGGEGAARPNRKRCKDLWLW